MPAYTVHDSTFDACVECGSTDNVTDWSHGDRICCGCGLVLESRMLDEGTSRQFANEEKPKSDLRYGTAQTQFGEVVSTLISSTTCGANGRLAGKHKFADLGTLQSRMPGFQRDSKMQKSLGDDSK